jgi:hypothetical protein
MENNQIKGNDLQGYNKNKLQREMRFYCILQDSIDYELKGRTFESCRVH